MRNRRKPVRSSEPSLGDILFAPDEVQMINGQECLSVAGIYRVAILSGSPVARPLVDWLVRDVLPAIELTGVYELPAGSAMPVPAALVVEFSKQREAMRQVKEQQAAELIRRACAPGNSTLN